MVTLGELLISFETQLGYSEFFNLTNDNEDNTIKEEATEYSEVDLLDIRNS